MLGVSVRVCDVGDEMMRGAVWVNEVVLRKTWIAGEIRYSLVS